MDRDVPFCANGPDNLHCVQASYMMILKYFNPDEDYSFEELDALTGKDSQGGTWAAQGHIWLVSQGYEIEYWTLLDWQRFVGDGYEYLQQQFGTEIADWQVKYGDIPLEQRRAAKALQLVPTKAQEPRIADIISFLDRGYLIKCTVNSSKLNGKAGYVGHVIVVKGYTGDALIIHDPGLPPLENRKVMFAEFEAAWAYPNAAAKEMTAIRLPEQKKVNGGSK